MKLLTLCIGAAALFFTMAASLGDVVVTTERNDSHQATAEFRFKNVPPPSKNDAAAQAEFSLLSGDLDRNGGSIECLNDGRVPLDEDQPRNNLFFGAGTAGGRIVVDLKKAVAIRQINSYSWHPNTRGPQVYAVHGSTGEADGFNPRPAGTADLKVSGWEPIARVDTRPRQGEPGGQYGVSIAQSSGAMGSYRYLLFDIEQTEDADAFGNTFYSEIDVIDQDGPELVAVSVPAAPPAGAREVVETDGGYRITIDTTEAADLTDWVRQELTPVVREWYPRIVEMLPSDGYEAPRNVTIVFNESQGVAAASGTRIRCSAAWFRRNLQGEARGAVVHELVHVVQQYGLGRRANRNAPRPPGWLVEGIPDYIRWFRYEPESKGAEITARNVARARYDGNYRISANFLNWVVGKHGDAIIRELNAASREGRYSAELWTQWAGKSVEELGADWKREFEERLGTTGAGAE